MNYIKMWIAVCALFLCLCEDTKAQHANEVNIKSTVLDAKGQPISSALIAGNEGKTTVFTDAAGHFSINVAAHSVVMINAKGFKMQSLRAGAVPESIVLAGEGGNNEVNVPYNKVDKQDLPGTITVLNPGTFINRDYNLTVQDALNGRAAGLLWSNNIWGMENAIVMIDGVRRDFNDVTLNEVQQITVLKGVNAVALYGSQAAKGVILITTKKGEANTHKVNLRVNTGIATPKALPKFLNSSDYMTLYNEARRNDGLGDMYDATTIQNYQTGNPYRFPSVDYYSSPYLKKYLNTTNTNAEFSGGNNTARFYSNIGWSNSSTLLNIGEGKNEGDNRFNIRGNIDLKLNDNISSTIDISTIFNDSRRGRTNYWGNAATLLPQRFTPLIPLSLISGSDATSQGYIKANRNIINGQYLLGGTQQYATNPIADLYFGGYDKFVQRSFQVTNAINVNLKNLLQGLSFHTLFNIDYANAYTQSISNTYAIYAPTWSTSSDSVASLTKYGTDYHSGTQNISGTAQMQNIGFSSWLNYEKSINEAHHFSVTLLGHASSIKTNDIYQPTTNSHVGLQLSYNYKHKYWADFSGAYVNSTKLPQGHRAALSPTASLGWLLSSEKFLSGSKVVDYLKLSASAGILNTDLDISGFYLYDNVYNRGATFNWNDGVQAGNQTSFPAYGSNPDLAFPKRKEVNASLEGAFFKHLLTLQTTFFWNEMDGLLTQRFSLYPTYFNAFVPYSNYNANGRSGVDIMLNVNKKIGELDLNLGVNATYATSKVTKSDGLYADAYQSRIGKPVDAIFGLQSKGFFADQSDIDKSPKQLFGVVKPGDIKYVDQNGDGIIDQRDFVMIGRYVAPFSYGITFNATYKNFNLFLLGTGNNGGYGLKNNDYYWVFGDKKYSQVVLNRWTPATKETATFPRLSSQQNNNDFRSSDFWLYKTDRFNLQKIQLTYNVSGNVLRKTFVKELGVYVSGSNLFTFSRNREILDLNIGTAPQFRNYMVGLRAGF
ncbi:SusC/RagA family TonB-linked outer membrane protein [Asinibacterium sp. OR53]|uniref:SusC/RagA family TonB-linked outer membrane protein n=1 Tax=Asinibacterium sp. OR53 TaxID=925409 RepID=UPI00047976C4|nr:SusC/RagA family TonB-linked outer membrane protein [Asinibacterium sp. OR53]